MLHLSHTSSLHHTHTATAVSMNNAVNAVSTRSSHGLFITVVGHSSVKTLISSGTAEPYRCMPFQRLLVWPQSPFVSLSREIWCDFSVPFSMKDQRLLRAEESRMYLYSKAQSQYLLSLLPKSMAWWRIYRIFSKSRVKPQWNILECWRYRRWSWLTSRTICTLRIPPSFTKLHIRCLYECLFLILA